MYIATDWGEYMLLYRTTPHSTTNESPSVLLFGRKLRTKLDMLIPSVDSNVEKKQNKIMEQTAHRGFRLFSRGDRVQVRNYGLGPKWKKGVVQNVLGKYHYSIMVDDRKVKRHVDQMLACSSESEENCSSESEGENSCAEVFKNICPVILEKHNNVQISKCKVDNMNEPKIVCENESSNIEPKVNDVHSSEIETTNVCQNNGNTVQNNIEKHYPTRSNRGQLPSKFSEFVPNKV